MANIGNFSIKVGMMKLNGAFLKNLKGNTATKRCLIIPVDDNDCMFVGEKDVYLNLTAIEVENPQYGDTHCVKPDIPKEKREQMTHEQLRETPILGNMRRLVKQEMRTQGTITSQDFVNDQGGQDDMPF